MFHKLYYPSGVLLSPDVQNIWFMNFANALFSYGLTYFFFKSLKPETRLIDACMWGIYYNISVYGFFSFMALGFIANWTFMLLVHDMLFAIISGALSGMAVWKLWKSFPRKRESP
jgi:ABC-type Co2+ transport system permease subunit